MHHHHQPLQSFEREEALRERVRDLQTLAADQEEKLESSRYSIQQLHDVVCLPVCLRGGEEKVWFLSKIGVGKPPRF